MSKCRPFVKAITGNFYFIPLLDNEGYEMWDSSPAVYVGAEEPTFKDALDILERSREDPNYSNYYEDIDRHILEVKDCLKEEERIKSKVAAVLSLEKRGLPSEISKLVSTYLFGTHRRKSRKSRRSRRSRRKSRRKSRKL